MMVLKRGKCARNLAGGVLFFCAVAARAQPPEVRAEKDVAPLSLAEIEPLIGGRTKVSLHLENAEMAEALAAAKRETGVAWRLAARTAPRGPVTLDLKDQPVWALYDALRGQVMLNRKATESAVVRDEIPLAPAETLPPVATRELELMQLRLGAPRLGKNHWIVPLTIFMDPKLDVVPGTTRLRLLAATDDKGNDLLGENRTIAWYRQYPLIWLASIAQLRLENMGMRLATLRGVLQFTAVLRRERWEVPLDGKLPIERKIERDEATETLSVDGVTPGAEPGTYEVQATRIRQGLIHSRFLPLMELRHLEAFNQTLFQGLKLLDGQGRAFFLQKTAVRADVGDVTLARTLVATFGRGPRETPAQPPAAQPAAAQPAAAQPAPGQAPAVTGPQGEPARLLWDIPLEVRPVEVPFEFNDLPLAP